MSLVTTQSYTPENVNNLKNYRRKLSMAIEKDAPLLKDNKISIDIKREISACIKYWKRQEKCAMLLLAFIEGTHPYDKEFAGFPPELYNEIKTLSVVCDGEITI